MLRCQAAAAAAAAAACGAVTRRHVPFLLFLDALVFVTVFISHHTCALPTSLTSSSSSSSSSSWTLPCLSPPSQATTENPTLPPALVSGAGHDTRPTKPESETQTQLGRLELALDPEPELGPRDINSINHRRQEEEEAEVAASPTQQQTPPPYTPAVTPPPDQDSRLSAMGYRLTTYYECNTVAGQEHCGWHVPVVKAEAPMAKTDIRLVLAVISCIAGMFTWGLL
ncbi:hypothetical protein PT974_05563 [Cladobotryum mycophilum]|uniref:Uncharacterized protein n=1 Tax=Cladobotryum mycophilum TaxID=491253 RepID=A0ABR0SJ52_9HYPO